MKFVGVCFRMKAILFTDIHFGLNLDSPDFHKITLDFGEWMKDEANKLGITTLICCGDVFHNRKNVFSPTIQAASKFFENLKEFDIRIITGNHDCYYLENSSVNSISMFKHWENITVYDEPFYENIDGKKVGFIPWGINVTDMEKCDVMFGHFEIQGFQMSATQFCEEGMNSTSLLEKCPLIFSGHFHKPQMTSHKKGKIVYLGSPFQHNWGEAGQSKYIYELDFSNLSYTSIENELSPKHVEISTEKDLEKIDGNIVRIITGAVDSDLSKKAAEKSALRSEVIVDKLDNMSKVGEIIKDFKGVDILDGIKELTQNIEGIDDAFKVKVVNKCKDLYQKVGT